ncbi:MAG: glycosyltransferase family 4 protein [Candidatus Paceibacterota bacterium]|jgi:glycosyltransferase involved in cell wall biosynthesis
MKVFYLITKSETGGPQTHISQLGKYLVDRGDQLALMSYPGGWQRGGWLEKEIEKMGGCFYPNEYLSNDINPIKDFLAIRKIRKAIKEFKPNVVSCHSSKAGVLGRIAIRNRIPTVFTAHGWGFTQGTSWERKFLIPLEKFSSKYCSKIICVSDNDRNLALKHKIAPADKIITIHNGVEIDNNFVFDEDKYRNLPIKIVNVGRFAPPKRQIWLLQAFMKLPDDLKKRAKIVFIGDGITKKETVSFIKSNHLEDKTEFTGDILRDGVFKTLSECHIFALISEWEGFPRTIIEAMIFGLPIISSDVGGARESVLKENGFLIPSNDIKEISVALEKLISNSDLMIQMGKASRKLAEDKFSLATMIEKTVGIYEAIKKP